MSHHAVRMSGIALSAASAAFSALIWTVVYIGATELPIARMALLFAVLSGVAFLAAVHSWLAVYAIFLVRVVPVGLYLLGVPSWLAVVGVLDLIYVAGGILMHVASSNTRSNPGSAAGSVA
jgi:hypothetical protein